MKTVGDVLERISNNAPDMIRFPHQAKNGKDLVEAAMPEYNAEAQRGVIVGIEMAVKTITTKEKVHEYLGITLGIAIGRALGPYPEDDSGDD